MKSILVFIQLLSLGLGQYDKPFHASPRLADVDKETEYPEETANSSIPEGHALFNNKPLYVQIYPQSLFSQVNNQNNREVESPKQTDISDDVNDLSSMTNYDIELITEQPRHQNNINIRKGVENGNIGDNSQLFNKSELRASKHIFVHLLSQGVLQNVQAQNQHLIKNPPQIQKLRLVENQPENVDSSLYSNEQSQSNISPIPIFPVLPNGNKVFILSRKPVVNENAGTSITLVPVKFTNN